MKSLRIINKNPTFYEIYKLDENTDKAISVFEGTYCFKLNEIPGDDEFEVLDKGEIKIDGKILLRHDLVVRFLPHCYLNANCIHVYKNMDMDDLVIEKFKFKNMNWNWVHYCYDDSWVELFFNKGSEYLYTKVRDNFECEEIEFPGSIYEPGSMIIF